MFQKIKDKLELKIWIRRKRAEIKDISFKTERALWILDERSHTKENGECGELAYVCGMESPMHNRNGTKDLSLMSMYHLKKSKSKRQFGHSADNLRALQVSIIKNIKLLNKFEEKICK